MSGQETIPNISNDIKWYYIRRMLTYGQDHFVEDLDGWERAAEAIFGDEPLTSLDYQE